MSQDQVSVGNSKPQALKVLTSQDIEHVKHALKKIGEFGEIHLVVEKGRVRFIRTITSETFGHSNGAND